jgi:hypothetical protein
MKASILFLDGVNPKHTIKKNNARKHTQTTTKTFNLVKKQTYKHNQ